MVSSPLSSQVPLLIVPPLQRTTMFRHHFLLVAYPAQGHVNPTLQLAKRLITLGVRVTLTTTLYFRRRITAHNPPTLPGLSFSPYSDGHDDTGFVGHDDAQYSLYLSNLARRGSHHITNLILSASKQPLPHPITCVVYTLLQTWAADVARDFHLPTTLLWVQPATVFNIFYHYFHGYKDYMDDKITKEPSIPSIQLPGLPSPLAPRDLPAFLLPSNLNFVSLFLPMFENQFRALDIQGPNATTTTVLVNTCQALEAEALRATDKLNFDVVSIGPLVPSEGGDSRDVYNSSSDGYMEWLDSKGETTVVYVSFGSFCVLSKRQMEEIARALLDCGRPFLWVIRDNMEKVEEDLILGESWRKELEKKGKIVKWCCQVEVLSHASLGCFVTHCGWNSTSESLVSGVPVVAFPLWAEQRTNAKLIEDDWETGVRVRVDEEGVVEAGEIGRCLDLVMGGDKGDEFRRNAEKWKGLAEEAVKEGGSSEKNLRTFLDDVERQSLCVCDGEV